MKMKIESDREKKGVMQIIFVIAPWFVFFFLFFFLRIVSDHSAF